MANTGQYDSQTNIELEDYEREIFVQPEAAVIYGGSVVNSVNGQTGDVILTTSDLENTSGYQTATEVQSAIDTAVSGKQDILTAGTGIDITSDVISVDTTTIATQADLVGKQNVLTPGNNIQINGDTISATDTTYDAGTGLDLSGTTFSVDTSTIATQQNIADEATARENADTNLQGQIDALTVSSDVIDVLGTYQDLQNYDTTHVKDNDIIKVLQDSTHNDAMSYYRWVITNHVGAWVYVGSEGPYYTKSESDVLLNAKQDTLISGTNIKTINNTSILGSGNIDIQSGGTSDYTDLTNKPSINNVTLSGNKSLNDLGIQPAGNYALESDMTEAQNDIENLQTENARLKATLPTTTGSGEEVTLEKTAELDFVKPPLPRGNTKQDTTTGKNLLQNTATSQTVSGVTFTVNEDGSVTCNGTATNNIFLYLTENDSIENIILNGCPAGGSGNSYLLRAIDANGRVLKTDSGEGTEVFNLINARIQIRIAKDYICNNLTFYPMIRLATIEDDTYEPYTGGIPSPNPGYPQEVEVVTGNVEVTISNENNTESKTLPVSLGNIELCKLGNYQDYLYKNNGKWYKHNAIKKLVLNGSESWNYNVQNNVAYLQLTTKVSSRKGLFSNLFSYYNGDWTTAPDNTISEATSSNFIFIKSTVASDNPAWKSWLSTHNTTVYYVLATPTDTEITDTTLISQLEEISKTLSYQGQTNITSNTIALFDVEAYQSTKLILENLDSRVTLIEG